MIRMNTIRLIMASRCCRKRLKTSWAWLRSLTVNSRSGTVSGFVATSRRESAPVGSSSVVDSSGIADPRVEQAVEQVGDEVEQDDERGSDEQPRLHGVDVALLDRGQQERAGALPLEHGLGHHGA